jgi:hypothetical protein
MDSGFERLKRPVSVTDFGFWGSCRFGGIYLYLRPRGTVKDPLGVTIGRVGVVFRGNDHQRGADLVCG